LIWMIASVLIRKMSLNQLMCNITHLKKLVKREVEITAPHLFDEKEQRCIPRIGSHRPNCARGPNTTNVLRYKHTVLHPFCLQVLSRLGQSPEFRVVQDPL